MPPVRPVDTSFLSAIGTNDREPTGSPCPARRTNFVMERRDHIEAILGYLNFSDGSPSSSAQQAVSEFFRAAATDPAAKDRPWESLARDVEKLADRETRFGNLAQARSVMKLTVNHLLPAYRQFHADLLGHWAEIDLFAPFFVARCFEAVLSQREPWTETDRIVRGSLHKLNDFLGHRPVAVLENQQEAQPYPHERVRPIPIFLREAGVGFGPHEPLIRRTLEILTQVPEEILESASLQLDRLDELAIDPRAYDHSHPVNQRPGYQFGEWDPHHLDQQGYFRRFVLRHLILQALSAWSERAEPDEREEADFEAAAALAGTMLLASGISGWGPGALSADTSLAELVPGVAAYRDAFYTHLLEGIPGKQGQRLRQEAKRLRQPFGGVRTFLNQYVARARGEQLQRDRLAILYAQMGFDDASRDQAQRIHVASTRFRAEINSQITLARRDALSGELARSAERLEETQSLLHRAIECGAMIDPWNILGFQGNFSRFQTIQDSMVDPRVDILLQAMQDLFDALALALRESAAQGAGDVSQALEEQFDRIAEWWDRFATVEVSGIRRVSGRDSLASARFVAGALREWRDAGESTGNVGFWRERVDRFTTTQAFGLVVEALIAQKDYVSAMALMMQWLNQHEECPLDDAGHSFHDLAIRWMSDVIGYASRDELLPARPGSLAPGAVPLVQKFFDYVEANAGTLWRVPKIEGKPSDEGATEDPFAAAYENVSYEDQTDDGTDSSLAESGSALDDGPWSQSEELMRRLRFIGTLARLWQLASHPCLAEAPLESWMTQLSQNTRDLRRFLQEMEKLPVPPPGPSRDSALEFERRSSVKEGLTAKGIYISIETAHALRTILALGRSQELTMEMAPDLPEWESRLIDFEGGVRGGASAEELKSLLKRVTEALGKAPLMYVPTDKGGRPTDVLAARYARDAIRMLALQLPSLGRFDGVYELLELVLELEHEQSARQSRMQISEFDLLFRASFRAVMSRVVDLFSTWDEIQESGERQAAVVGQIVSRFSDLWTQYISSVRISELERRRSRAEWSETVKFIKTFGRGLFTQAFMAEGNLRGLVHQGAIDYLGRWIHADEFADHPLTEAIEQGVIGRKNAADQLDFIARSMLECYDVYRDYNTTTPQSDYGENLHLVFELLKHRVEYDRYRWALDPAYIAHGTLVRQGLLEAAALLREAIARETVETAQDMADRLAKSENRCGFHLETVRGRIMEGFVGQLRLDQTLALGERSLSDDEESAEESFRTFHDQVEGWCLEGRGSGVEIPEWLRQVETVIDQALDLREGRLVDVEQLAAVRPRAVSITLEELERQIEKKSTS